MHIKHSCNLKITNIRSFYHSGILRKPPSSKMAHGAAVVMVSSSRPSWFQSSRDFKASARGSSQPEHVDTLSETVKSPALRGFLFLHPTRNLSTSCSFFKPNYSDDAPSRDRGDSQYNTT
ncbi:hypothetical protein NPIL_477231 [Nephila pilipes]|uniref:Uncharacterized protein n=1 Tax=Nephila pilipes TaxID=299642 RepID=A0A8X6PRT2_NEPPI|nr:hypothetical protein NPIL_477231 [Nephila pilipes]